MRKFTVIPLTMGGLRNKIFKKGQEVSEDQFPKGTVDDLVRKKFLKPIEESTTTEPAKTDDEKKSDVSVSNDVGNSEKALKPIEEFSTKQLKKELRGKKEFSENASKEELYTLWVSLQD